jgi:general secretion pathway protein B
MSLILDALKKLDREKSSRRNGTSNIAVEILRPDPTRPAKGIPLYILAIALTAVVASAITYMVVKSYFTSKPLSSAALNPPTKIQESSPGPRYSAPAGLPEVAQSPAPSQTERPSSPKADSRMTLSPPPAVSPPTPSPQVVPAPVSHEPILETRDELNRLPPKSDTPVERKTTPTFSGEKDTGQSVIVEKATVAPGNTEQPAERIPFGPAVDPSALRLSAIVWHEEPSRRIAVINGTITTEQSVIEGVKIEVIYPNRVRLSQNGRPFELLLK